MAVVNHETKEVTFKIVYCGTPMGGKTTNLGYIHGRIDPSQRGELVSLATSADRTLFFDFLPIQTVVINGYATRFMLYTVPGQVCYHATRQLVLKGADGIVFVADSHPARMEETVQSWHSMVKNLHDNGVRLEDLPMVLQYNKRDLPDAAPVPYLEYLLNNGQERRLSFEASAASGYNVFATLNAVAEQVLRRFHHATSARTHRVQAPAPSPAALASRQSVPASSGAPGVPVGATRETAPPPQPPPNRIQPY